MLGGALIFSRGSKSEGHLRKKMNPAVTRSAVTDPANSELAARGRHLKKSLEILLETRVTATATFPVPGDTRPETKDQARSKEQPKRSTSYYALLGPTAHCASAHAHALYSYTCTYCNLLLVSSFDSLSLSFMHFM